MSQKGKKNCVNYNNIAGGPLKDHRSRDLGSNPILVHRYVQKHIRLI